MVVSGIWLRGGWLGDALSLGIVGKMWFIVTSRYSLLLLWSTWRTGEGPRALLVSEVSEVQRRNSNRNLSLENTSSHQTRKFLSGWFSSLINSWAKQNFSSIRNILGNIVNTIEYNSVRSYWTLPFFYGNHMEQNISELLSEEHNQRHCVWVHGSFLHPSTSACVLADRRHHGFTKSGRSIWNGIQNC